MVIAFFLDCFTPTKNGVVTVALDLKRTLERKGHRVVIVATTTGPTREDEDHLLFHTITMEKKSKQDFGLALVQLARTKRFLLKNKVEVIHTHTEFAVGMAGMWLSNKLGIPRVATVHTLWDMYRNYSFLFQDSPLWRGYTKVYMSGVKQICAPSGKIAEYNRRVVPSVAIEVIQNGVDVKIPQDRKEVRVKYAIKENDICAVFTGRLGPEKRVLELLTSLVPLLKAEPTFKLILVGDGSERDKLAQIAAENSVSDSVILTGFVTRDEALSLCAAADLFCTASLSEVHSISALEALNCGLPCVVRQDSSFDGVVENHVNGYQAKTDTELADLVRSLVKHADLRYALGLASKGRAAEYTADKQAELLLGVYKSTLT